MKPINEVEVFRKEKLACDHRLAVMMMIQQQIDVVGDLMSRHKELVKSPLSYNMCAGLIDQLKTHAHTAFNDGAPAAPGVDGSSQVPYFRFPDDIIGL
jgi:hypothetical protein